MLSRDQLLSYISHLSGFTYYRQLSPAGKKKFINRLLTIMVNKKFTGQEGLMVTDEMKVKISACIAQVTFGLRIFSLSHFRVVRIFPGPFYSKRFGRNLKGGTSEAGMVMLSWADFVKGYEDPDDRYNLGLHEMAHALKVQVLRGDTFDTQFAAYLDNWLEIGSLEFEKMKNGKMSFLRAYGGTNMHEFFAVCVEHFFEVPGEFRMHLPDVYRHLCVLLNQDPANGGNDYAL